MPEPKKIHVRFGKIELHIIDKKTGNLVEKKEIEKITALAPIVVLSEKRGWYVRGLGILIKTIDNKKYCLKICSVKGDDENIIKEFNNMAIIDYKEYGKIIAFINGYKISPYVPRILFAKGRELKGTGVLFSTREYEFNGRVPLEIYYPYGLKITLKYPKEIKKLPIEKDIVYKLVVIPEKTCDFVDYVEIPDFAIRQSQ